jgi:hypothetical protein
MGCAIRNQIRSLRGRRGDMTQQALADRIAVTRQTVKRHRARQVLADARGGLPHRGRVRRAARRCLSIRRGVIVMDLFRYDFGYEWPWTLGHLIAAPCSAWPCSRRGRCRPHA